MFLLLEKGLGVWDRKETLCCMCFGHLEIINTLRILIFLTQTRAQCDRPPWDCLRASCWCLSLPDSSAFPWGLEILAFKTAFPALLIARGVEGGRVAPLPLQPLSMPAVEHRTALPGERALAAQGHRESPPRWTARTSVRREWLELLARFCVGVEGL